MTLFDIPVGFASVFMMILIGYFVLTVWFGTPQVPVVVKASAPPSPVKSVGEEAHAPPVELNVG